jgi:hypothetical protein
MAAGTKRDCRGVNCWRQLYRPIAGTALVSPEIVGTFPVCPVAVLTSLEISDLGGGGVLRERSVGKV